MVSKKIGNYTLEREIGFGTFSRVYQAKDQKGNNFAIKMISKEHINPELTENIDQEIQILQSLDNPRIIKLVDSKKTANNWYLIFEYCQYGDLHKFMNKHFSNGFPMSIVQKIMQQICQAMFELRKLKIVHRDLKLGNILINEGFNIKLADFGFAKNQIEQDYMMSFCGTPITMAPEILKRDNYNEKCDIWSLGILSYQLMTGKPPFLPKPGNNVPDMLLKIINKNQIDFSQIDSKGAIDFLKRTLQQHPQKRIGYEQLFQHPWIVEQIQDNDQTLIKRFKGIIENKKQNFNQPSNNSEDSDGQEDQDIILTKQISSKITLHEEPDDCKHIVDDIKVEQLMNILSKQCYQIQLQHIQDQIIPKFNILIEQIHGYKEVNKQPEDIQIIQAMKYLMYQNILYKLITITKRDFIINKQASKKIQLPWSQDVIEMLKQIVLKVQKLKQEQNSQKMKEITQLQKNSTILLNKFLIDKMNSLAGAEVQQTLEDLNFLKLACQIIQNSMCESILEITVQNLQKSQTLEQKIEQIKENQVKDNYIKIQEVQQYNEDIESIERLLLNLNIFKIEATPIIQKNQIDSNQYSQSAYTSSDLNLIQKIINDQIEDLN